MGAGRLGRFAAICACAALAGLALGASSQPAGQPDGGDALPALQTKVSLKPPYPESYPGAATDKLSVQFAVAAVCKQAGVGYDPNASLQNVGDAARLWVRPNFKDTPLDEALGLILSPLALTYEIEDGRVVLRRKEAMPPRPAPEVGPSASPLSAAEEQRIIEQAVATASGVTVADKALNAATAIAQYRLASQVPGLQAVQQRLAQAQQNLARVRAQTEAVSQRPGDWVFDVPRGKFDERVLNAPQGLTVVVDFWAAWCGPCRTLAPVLERVVKSYGGRAVLARVNIDEDSEAAARFKIEAIPTVKVFRGGRQLGEFVGAPPEKEVDGILQPLVYGRRPSEQSPAEAELAAAQAEWARAAGQYQQELTRISNEVYPKCLEMLQAAARELAGKARDASIAALKETFQPGTYSWTVKGQVLGKVELRPDGSVIAQANVVGQGARWELAEQGLVVADGPHLWVFTAGPGGTYLGKCTSDDLRMRNQTAMLGPVGPATKAASEAGEGAGGE